MDGVRIRCSRWQCCTVLTDELDRNRQRCQSANVILNVTDSWVYVGVHAVFTYFIHQMAALYQAEGRPSDASIHPAATRHISGTPAARTGRTDGRFVFRLFWSCRLELMSLQPRRGFVRVVMATESCRCSRPCNCVCLEILDSNCHNKWRYLYVQFHEECKHTSYLYDLSRSNNKHRP